MASRDQHRAHYDAFVADITDLCRDNKIRAALRSGRGRPATQCARMDRYLVPRVRGHGAKRAHYTTASLIALTRPEPDTHPDPDTASELIHQTPVPALHRDPATPSGAPLLDITAAPDTTALPDAPGPETAAAWRARPNLGTTLALAVHHHAFNPGSTEQTLYTFTKLSADLLQPRLPGLTERLRDAHAASPDFAVLLADLAWWDADRDLVTARWRESFHLTLDALDRAPAADLEL